MQRERKIVPRTPRILSIFHLFKHCQEVSFKEITDQMPIGRKTIVRDIELLRQAGLLNIRYSKRLRAFVPADGDSMICRETPQFPDSKQQRLYMKKIIRLTALMCAMNEKSDPAVWYRANYPELSRRTMQRDFSELREIGYRTYYQSTLYYDGDHPAGSYYCGLPDGAYGLDTFDPLTFGPDAFGLDFLYEPIP